MILAAGSIDYPATFLRLFIDLVAVGALAGGVFLRRHQRRDLAIVYAAFNVGLFAVVSVISARHISVGVGFGLFAVLSIVRLRSEPFDNIELAYFFMTLVLALVNGLAKIPIAYTVILDVLVLGTMFLTDHPSFHTATFRRRITLDEIYTDVEALREQLESRLGVVIAELRITENDFVRETTSVTLRYAEREPGDPLDGPGDSTTA